MRPHKKSRRGRTIVEADNVDRWIVSYADFVTLLFAFFVVMYAISSINEGKYRVLSDTLVAAFKNPPKSIDPVQVGQPLKDSVATQNTIGVPKPIRVEPPPSPEIQKKSRQQQQMSKLAQRVSESLRPLIDQKHIKVTHTDSWVEVEINTSILFSSGSAELELEAGEPLKKLAEILQSLPNYIDVEGHTDNLPISNAVYPSNWELSASRAASVVHLFVKNGVEPEKLSAIGFGEFRPVASNDSINGRRQNRRVKVIILADKDARRLKTIEQSNSGAE